MLSRTDHLLGRCRAFQSLMLDLRVLFWTKRRIVAIFRMGLILFRMSGTKWYLKFVLS